MIFKNCEHKKRQAGYVGLVFEVHTIVGISKCMVSVVFALNVNNEFIKKLQNATEKMECATNCN